MDSHWRHSLKSARADGRPRPAKITRPGVSRMSRALLNQIFGSVLVTMLVTIGIGNLVNEVFHRTDLAQNAYPVQIKGAVASTAPAPAEPAALPAVSDMLAAADLAAGTKLGKRCGACHTFTKGGAKKVGPNLWGIIGATKAAVAGYTYSKSLQDIGGTWTFEELNAFLASPKGYAPGTKMTFAGLKKARDRANLIAWLRGQADTPVALPTQ